MYSSLQTPLQTQVHTTPTTCISSVDNKPPIKKLQPITTLQTLPVVSIYGKLKNSDLYSLLLSPVPTISPVITNKSRCGIIRTLTTSRPVNKFVWDGSFLGVITGDNILSTFIYGGLSYLVITMYGHVESCIVRQIRTISPCLSDELKVLFSVPKLGTHRIEYHDKMYILIRARMLKNGKLCIENDLTLIKPDNKVFVERVQDIYLFRDILGLTMSRDGSIMLRQPTQSYLESYPISFYENVMRPDDANPIIPTTVFDKWFQDIHSSTQVNELSLNDVARRVFRVKSIKDVQTRIIFIQDKLNSIIERVDRDAVWMIRPIIEKLTRRMTFGMMDNEKTVSEWNWDETNNIHV